MTCENCAKLEADLIAEREAHVATTQDWMRMHDEREKAEAELEAAREDLKNYDVCDLCEATGITPIVLCEKCYPALIAERDRYKKALEEIATYDYEDAPRFQPMIAKAQAALADAGKGEG